VLGQFWASVHVAVGVVPGTVRRAVRISARRGAQMATLSAILGAIRCAACRSIRHMIQNGTAGSIQNAILTATHDAPPGATCSAIPQVTCRPTCEVILRRILASVYKVADRGRRIGVASSLRTVSTVAHFMMTARATGHIHRHFRLRLAYRRLAGRNHSIHWSLAPSIPLPFHLTPPPD
jgi:hypothetical protein